MPVRELAPDEEVLPEGFIPVPDTPGLSFRLGGADEGGVRELQPDEEIIPLAQSGGGLTRTEQFGRGSNIGIAEMLGGPVDLVNAGLGLVGLGSEEPVGGSQQIRRGFAALGLAPPVGVDDPDSLFGSMGRVTGAAATMLLPVGPIANFATRVLTGIRAPARTVAGAITQEIGAAAVTAPGRFAAAEAAAGAAAGAGGFFARERFPDSEAASFIGELAGGLTPAGVVGAVRLIPSVLGINLARRVVRPLTEGAARGRAERRMEELAREPGAALAELEAPQVIPEARLTAAQRAGDEGLLSLERSVIESSEQLKGRAGEQVAQATSAIRQSLREFGEGIPIEKTTAALEEARNYAKFLLDTRMRIAAQRADERIAELAPGATREEANLIAREELESARSAARGQERELWAAVPEELALSTENSKRIFTDILEATPRAQRDDISATAKRFLDPDSKEVFAATESVAELQGLRSKLLEESRVARAAGNFNAARIANEMADAVLTDLGAQREAITGETGEILRAALDFSADFNAKFTQGSVGRLLGAERRGGIKVPEALTLEKMIGTGGPRARVEAKALLDAVESSGRTPALRGAIQDFLLNDFERRAIREGRIDPKKAQSFLTRNDDILEEFPELRSQLESAIEANDVAMIRAEKAEGLAKRLNDPKVSRAAIFLKEPTEDAMQRVAKSGNPEKTMRELVRQAKRDPTGDALRGLKTAFGDLLLQRSTTKRVTETDELIVSGLTLERMLREGPVAKMAKELLSPKEQKRLTDIVSVAEKLERAIAAKARPEGIIGDNPALIFSVMAGVMGAQVGRKIATVTGGGTVQTPGIMANVFRKALTALTRDPARRLLMDAMGDEKLFAALLNKGITVKDGKTIRKRLNAWLVSIGAEQLREGETIPPEEKLPRVTAPIKSEAAIIPEVAPTEVTNTAIEAIIQQESGGDPNAVSRAGAVGLAQIMPKTAKDPGFGVTPVTDPKDPKQARRFIREYLGAMLKRYDGDYEAALVAYNWGPGNADRWVKQGKKRDKLPKETRNYVKKLLPQVRG